MKFQDDRHSSPCWIEHIGLGWTSVHWLRTLIQVGILSAVLLSAAATNSVQAAEQLKRFEFLQIRMGIPVNIILYAPLEATANQAAKAAFDRIRDIDRSMSDYDPDSELMQLCRNASPGVPVSVSADLFTVLKHAQALSHRTQGAFDVTVGPVVKLWRIARRRKQLPDPDRLENVRQQVNFQYISLNPCQQTVELTKPGIQIDLGAIAKGYAADEALKAMQQFGVPRAMVDAGGDIVVGDPPPDRSYWRIEVEKLRPQDSKLASPPVVHLRNAAIATSGDAYQFLEIDGVRYSHIVDPATGLGLTTPSTVTIIAPTGMQADSLASAVSVLGPESGLRLIQAIPQTECFITWLRENDDLQQVSSSGFASFLIENDGQ